MDGPELWEDYGEEIRPAADDANRGAAAGSRPPEEMLGTRPRPAPILFVLVIVVWLWVPFVASVVLLVVIVGIFAAVEDPRELLSLQASSSPAGELRGLISLRSLFGRSSGLWDVSSTLIKLWNQLLDSSPALQAITRDGVAVAATQVDWMETSDAHIFKADMPGLTKEDVKVELEGDSILQISGQRSREGEESRDAQETWHRVERSQGRFSRRFQLPADSKVDEVQAKVENGVLTVRVPKRKKQPVPTRAIAIQ